MGEGAACRRARRGEHAAVHHTERALYEPGDRTDRRPSRQRPATVLDHRTVVDGADRRIEGRFVLRLQRHGQDPFPRASEGVHHTRRRRHQTRDRDVYDAVVHQSRRKGRVSGHGPVYTVLGQQHAIERVARIRGHRTVTTHNDTAEVSGHRSQVTGHRTQGSTADAVENVPNHVRRIDVFHRRFDALGPEMPDDFGL